ncbi:MAG: carboxylating nicotinate-nucleotide diphosphorylase [Porphyromonadaceae bacterium]|nr:carboxylating nicotinate-nucleotide diphosphorylase [Porphyromonadaceae bacterium]
MKTKDELIDDLLTLAFAEDVGDGDHTTLSTIPAEAMGRSRLLCKEEGIIAGIDVAEKVLHRIDPTIRMERFLKDGDLVKKGDVAFIAEGPVRSLLIAERTMLNIMQRMSGVATMTRRYQDELEGLHTRVLDTRKTTPGMRMLEKDAVAIGGGKNHRIGLFDMILIKDNHIDFAGGIKDAIDGAHAYLKKIGKKIPIEVEARSLDDIRRILEIGGVDRIMFDNFTPELTREAVKLVDGRTETESSGGITLENLRAYGEAGVDFISVGALTHSVKGLDMSFKAC